MTCVVLQTVSDHSNQLPVTGDVLKKRSLPLDNKDSPNNHELGSKRIHYGPESQFFPVQSNDFGRDNSSANGLAIDVPLQDDELNPVEKMIAVIGAFLAEGERGAESLEILVSKIHPDLLADIVITNMKNLPKNPPPLTSFGNVPGTRPVDSISSTWEAVSVSPPTNFIPSPTFPSQMSTAPPTVPSSLVSDLPTYLTIDPKRDPRRVILISSCL